VAFPVQGVKVPKRRIVTTAAAIHHPAAAGAFGGVSAGSLWLLLDTLLRQDQPPRIAFPHQVREPEPVPEHWLDTLLRKASFENLCFFVAGLLAAPTFEAISVFRLLLRRARAFAESRPLRRAVNE